MSKTGTRLRLTAAVAAVLVVAGVATGPAAQAHPRQPGLADLAQRHGRYFGSAVDNPALTDGPYLKISGDQFDMITPANGMKWYATEP